MQTYLEKEQFNDSGRIKILNGLRCFYSKTNDCNFTPCMDITLCDPVDTVCLQSALEMAMNRFRIFRLEAIQEDEKYYLKYNPRPPIVHGCNQDRRILDKAGNNGNLIRVGASETHILIDFFQGITDGRGIQPFVKNLLSNYCGIRYERDWVKEAALVDMQKENEECMDSLLFVNENRVSLRREKCGKTVFHFGNSQITPGMNCFRYSIYVNAAEFDSYVQKNKTGRSATFATFMNRGIASNNDIEDCTIVTSVAADVRKILGVEKTLREGTGTIPLYYDKEIHKLAIEDQLSYAEEAIVSGMIPEKQLAAAAETKKNNIQVEKRINSLEGKKQFACRVHPYAYQEYTYAMSNIGRISFGQEIDQYISSVKVTSCANTYPVVIEIIRFKDTYNICYCTRIENDPYVHRLVDNFISAGISCSYQQEEDYTEPLVVL